MESTKNKNMRKSRTVTTQQEREAVLLICCYGASIKSFILNKKLWSYLTETYHVDVISDTNIIDFSKLGIRKAFTFDWKIGLLGRILRAIDFFFINRIFQAHYASLLLETGFAFLYGRIHSSWLRTDKKKSRVFLWSAIRKSRLFKALKRLIPSFPIFTHAWCTLTNIEDYKFVLISNFITTPSYLMARYAKKRHVPVFASIMGIDNVSTGGPFMANPDLLFLWGREQLFEFEKIQKRYNPGLSSTKPVLCGNLIYDTYLELSEELECRIELERRYGIQRNREIILFPAYSETAWPNQSLLCKKILNFIKENDLSISLLVRVRPGIDEDMWVDLHKETKGEIAIQIPKGSAYDKSCKVSAFSISSELEDVKEFVFAFKSASLVVLPSFSSTVIDANLFGVPAFIAAFGYGGKYTSAEDQVFFYNTLKMFYPHRGDYNVFWDESSLFNALHSFFIENKRDDFVSRRLFETIAYSDDGNVGERYVDAIQSFF